MRRALGWLMLAIGFSGIVLSILGVIVGRQFVDATGASLQSNLTLTIDSLETVRDTLSLTKTTVGELDEGLETAEEAANNVSVALAETGPLLVEGSRVVTEDVPESIETFQQSMPALIEVSGAIDSTLRTLNAFNVDRTILGIPLSFDLGVQYDPEVPFDQSVQALGASLEGMPEELRGLEDLIGTTNENLLVVSQDLARLSADLEGMNSNIGEVEPLIDEYITIVTDLSDRTRQSRALLNRQVQQAKLALTIVMIWMGLFQVAPLYLGWELVSGRRDPQPLHGLGAGDDETVVAEKRIVVREEVTEHGTDDA